MNKKWLGAGIVLMLFSFFIYSLTGVFLKLTSQQYIPSLDALVYFLLAIVTLAIYAVLWQVILKSFNLSKAFLSKSITIVYSMLFASLLFGEEITINNVIGSIFIILGILMNCKGRENIL